MLPAAAALGLGVLPWSPLGPRRADRQVPHRHAVRLPRRVDALRQLRRPLPRRRGPPAIVEAVARAAEGLGWSTLEVALAWVRDRPGVTAPIVGARTAAQLRGALGVEELTLPAEITAALDDVSAD